MPGLLPGRDNQKFSEAKELTFDYFDASHRVLRFLEMLYFLQLIVSIFVYFIGSSILLEEIQALNNCLLDKNGVKKSGRVIVFRMVVFVLMVTPAFLRVNEYYLIIVIGGLFMPCISVLLPVIF